jgi:hypothetical protein
MKPRVAMLPSWFRRIVKRVSLIRTLKRYWPRIIPAATVVILVPVILRVLAQHDVGAALASARTIAQISALAAGFTVAILLARNSDASGAKAAELEATVYLAAGYMGALGFAIDAKRRARKMVEIQTTVFEFITEHQPLDYHELEVHTSSCMGCAPGEVRAAVTRITDDDRIEFDLDTVGCPAGIRPTSFQEEYLKVLRERGVRLHRSEDALCEFRQRCELFLKDPRRHRLSRIRRLNGDIRRQMNCQ